MLYGAKEFVAEILVSNELVSTSGTCGSFGRWDATVCGSVRNSVNLGAWISLDQLAHERGTKESRLRF